MQILFDNSDRNNPGSWEYFQKTSDVISIFWLFHKRLLETGNASFAYSYDNKTVSLVPFSPSVEFEYPGNIAPLDMVSKYADGVECSMKRSWGIFLRGLGFNARDFVVGDHVEFILPDSVKPLLASYTRELIEDVQVLGETYAVQASGKRFKAKEIIPLGMETGSEVTTQLDAIFGEEMNPLYAILVSKIRGDFNREAHAAIGIPDTKKRYPWSYDLLEPINGIDREKLKAHDYGVAIGCPASMKPSPQTKAFLQDEFGVLVERTMLDDFATQLHYNFDTVRSWYQQLNTEGRMKLVTQKDRDTLEGRIWNTIKGNDDLPQLRCPYSKERF